MRSVFLNTDTLIGNGLIVTYVSVSIVSDFWRKCQVYGCFYNWIPTL